eukprot:364961-Chlamydomonas_euryale.AAC.5
MLCDACAQLLSSADFGSGDGNGSGGSILPADVPTLLAGDFNSLASKRVPDVFDPQIPPGGMSSGECALRSLPFHVPPKSPHASSLFHRRTERSTHRSLQAECVALSASSTSKFSSSPTVCFLWLPSPASYFLHPLL